MPHLKLATFFLFVSFFFDGCWGRTDPHGHGAFIIIADDDPEFEGHNHISASRWAESKTCRTVKSVDNLKESWFWSNGMTFIVAGSLHQQLTLRHLFLKKSHIPKNDLGFADAQIPYPTVGVVLWTLWGDLAFVQNQTVDPYNIAKYTSVPMPDEKANTQVDTSYVAKQQDTVVMTDNKDWALIVSCINDKYMNYFLATSGPSIGADVLEKVRHKITQLGFNAKYFRVVSDYKQLFPLSAEDELVGEGF